MDKLNTVADYLSRTPCWGLTINEGKEIEAVAKCRRVTTQHAEHNSLGYNMTEAARQDKNYTDIPRCIQIEKPKDEVEELPNAKVLKPCLDTLERTGTIEFGNDMLITFDRD